MHKTQKQRILFVMMTYQLSEIPVHFFVVRMFDDGVEVAGIP